MAVLPFLNTDTTAMRSFGPNDKLEPVPIPPLDPGDTPAKRRRKGRFLLIAGLVFAIAGPASDQGASGWGTMVFGLLAIVMGALILRSTKAGYTMNLPLIFTPLFGLWMALTAVGYWNRSHFFALIALAGLLLAVLGTTILGRRALHERKVAQEMHAAAFSAATMVDPDIQGASAAAAPAAMRLDVYLQRELPMLDHYRPVVTAEYNIVGQRPPRILYLYNFFAEALTVSEARWGGAWRRFGPVYFLGSPKSVSYGKEEVSKLLLTTTDAVDQFLSTAQEQPMAPGNPDLTGYAYYSGGYSQHMLLCTDTTWRHAVSSLLSKANLVLIDASNYRPTRAGLNWEIAHLVDHVSTEKFVILADEATDQVAIGQQFRQAWARMRGNSPNNRPDASPIRMLLIETILPGTKTLFHARLVSKETQAKYSPFPEEFTEAYGAANVPDPASARDGGHLMKTSTAKHWAGLLVGGSIIGSGVWGSKSYLGGQYRNIPSTDRIFGLLMDSKPATN